MDTTISAQVFYAVQRDCSGKWALHKGVLNFHNIMFVTKGSCDFYFDGRKRRLSAGDVAYFAKGTEREANNHSPETQLYAFDFDLFGCDRLPLSEVTHLGSFESFTPSFKSFFFHWYQKHDGYMMTCSGMFTMILAALIYPNTQKKPNPHVDAMKEYIIEHLNEAVTVEQISDVVSLSPAYCGELFIRSEGTTIHEFINKMRINRAKDLLISDMLSISEISAMIGYNDIFYFSKKFKMLTGMSPSEYKRLYKRQ